MAFGEGFNAYFVKIGNNLSETHFASDEEFEKARSLLHSHCPNVNVCQIQPSEGLAFIASDQLTKKDVFVLNRFAGDFFRQLQHTKALIVGPPCLIKCVTNEEAIPSNTCPVYTTAMRNLRISGTGITSKEKEHVREYVQWMGGHYYADFGRSITHLVSNTIRSSKYEQAALCGVPVMHVDWVQRVWERSCADAVAATDKEFEKYTLPIFFGTNITSSGFSAEKKNQISQLVNDNGGTYHSCFRSQIVDIVITDRNKTDSDKYKAAVRYKKCILLPEWITESVAKGFALPMKSYVVKGLNASTPTKSQQSVADFTAVNSSHLSDISRISVAGANNRTNLMNTVNETMCSNAGGGGERGQTTVRQLQSTAGPTPAAKELHREVLKKWTADTNYHAILDEISLKLARKAGTFLDGCCIYLSGFRSDEREKLVRVLNAGGATRYDAVNEKITHIIVGKLNDEEYKCWKKDGILTGAHIVTLHWLSESIRIKQPASEVVYRMPLPTTQAPETPSPSSKRTLRSMNHSFKLPDKPIKKKLFDVNDLDVTKAKDAAAADTSKAKSNKQANGERERDADADDEQNLIAQYSQEHLTTAFDAVPLPPKRPTTSEQRDAKNNATLHASPIASSTLRPSIIPAAAAAATTTLPDAKATNDTEMTDVIDYENLNFLEGITVYVFESHFLEDFYSQMLYECEAAKGDIVPATFRDTVDYAIVSFERTLDVSTLPVKAKHIINDLYVETCLKLNKFIPIEYYHKHIPHTAAAHPLKNMTIVVSTYSDLERDFVDSIIELLGARLNKTFVKKERPLLVCPLPEGSKYQGAIKWGYPVVRSEWLLDCAVQGRKLTYESYLVGESVADFPASPALRERNSDVSEKTLTPDTPQNLEMEAGENVSKETVTEFTPLRNRRVSELAGVSRIQQNCTNTAGNESPHTPTNQLVGPTYDVEIMEAMLAEIDDEGQRECWREIISEIRKNPTPQLERIRRQACTPNNRGKWPSPKGIPEFCTTPAYKQRMRDEFERRYRLPIKQIPPDTPIEEICRRVLYATCKSQGIHVSSDEEPQYKQQDPQQPKQQGSGNSSAKKQKNNNGSSTTPVQRTSSIKANAVAPRTLFDNEQTTPHSDKTYVPNTQTPPNVSQHVTNVTATASVNAMHASVMGKSTIDFDKISFEDSQLAVGAAGHSATTANKSNVSFSPEVKQITDYLKNCETLRRQSLKRSAAARTDEPPHQLARDDVAPTEGHFVQAFESEQFGGTEEMVGWQDPAQFAAARQGKLVPQMQHTGTPCFSISCAQEHTKQDIITKIQKLGGKICENLSNFDEQCTHFLCERPNRGEKTLGCISSGKWVLSLRYIEESHAKNAFVDEELYEWGNCKAINMPQLNGDEQVIATAAHRWRRELAVTQTGVFTGIRAILRISERHLNSLKAVIKAGSGEIVEAQSPYSRKSQAHLATHCFVDMKRNPLTREDYNFLVSNNIKVLTQMYINEYLMHSRETNCSQYEVKL